MEWLFINNNNLTSLENQLPVTAPNLLSLFLFHNRLKRLPLDIRNLPKLDVLLCEHNEIESLDGVLAKAREIKILDLTDNKLQVVCIVFFFLI